MAEANLGGQGGAIDKVLSALRFVHLASENINLRQSTNNPGRVEVTGRWDRDDVIRIDIVGKSEDLQELLR